MRLRYCTGALVLTVAFSLSSAARLLYPPAHTAANGNSWPFVAPLYTGTPGQLCRSAAYSSSTRRPSFFALTSVTNKLQYLRVESLHSPLNKKNIRYIS